MMNTFLTNFAPVVAQIWLPRETSRGTCGSLATLRACIMLKTPATKE